MKKTAREMLLEELTPEQKIKYVQDTLYVISGKWKLPILIAISHKGNNRFREIQRSVYPITTRVLSKELKDLEENKLVIRTVYDSSPVIVDYSVSTYCKSLTPMVEEMILWGKNHRDKIRES